MHIRQSALTVVIDWAELGWYCILLEKPNRCFFGPVLPLGEKKMIPVFGELVEKSKNRMYMEHGPRAVYASSEINK